MLRQQICLCLNAECSRVHDCNDTRELKIKLIPRYILPRTGQRLPRAFPSRPSRCHSGLHNLNTGQKQAKTTQTTGNENKRTTPAARLERPPLPQETELIADRHASHAAFCFNQEQTTSAALA